MKIVNMTIYTTDSEEKPADSVKISASVPSTDASQQVSSGRVFGYDLARSLAILGMTVIHFRLVMVPNVDAPSFFGEFFNLLDGRPATLFMLLAGIGITLMSRDVENDLSKKRLIQKRLVTRGVFLLAVGFINLIEFPGDILRVYGISFFVAAFLLETRKRTLVLMSVLFFAGLFVFMAFFDYEKNWDWETVTYNNLWTTAGALRNLTFDGFRSVFPWTGVLILGMFLGRLNLSHTKTRRIVLACSLVIAVAVELFSRTLLAVASAADTGIATEELVAIFGTQSLPPLPLFLATSIAAATAVICFCIEIANAFPESLIVRSLVATGQMAFTWYMAHIYLGLGVILTLGLINQSNAAACVAGLVFFFSAAVISLVWRGKEKRGPLEWLMRKVCG